MVARTQVGCRCRLRVLRFWVARSRASLPVSVLPVGSISSTLYLGFWKISKNSNVGSSGVSEERLYLRLGETRGRRPWARGSRRRAALRCRWRLARWQARTRWPGSEDPLRREGSWAVPADPPKCRGPASTVRHLQSARIFFVSRASLDNRPLQNFFLSRPWKVLSKVDNQFSKVILHQIFDSFCLGSLDKSHFPVFSSLAVKKIFFHGCLREKPLKNTVANRKCNDFIIQCYPRVKSQGSCTYIHIYILSFGNWIEGIFCAASILCVHDTWNIMHTYTKSTVQSNIDCTRISWYQSWNFYFVVLYTWRINFLKCYFCMIYFWETT